MLEMKKEYNIKSLQIHGKMLPGGRDRVILEWTKGGEDR
jgi:hypothetical protein